MNKWYKFLSEAVEKKSLQEITSQEYRDTKLDKYLKNKESDQLETLFDGKKRFAIPVSGEIGENPRDREMLGYINQLREQGWTIDFSEPFGYAFKIIKSEYDGKTFENKRKMKIGPLVSALSPEAAEFWTRHNKFYTTETNQFYFNSKYMIVVSRVPIDILRMSDHDGWTSCHSPSGGYFRCAIAESVEGGAVAYVVKNEQLEEANLNSDEIFRDKDRSIDGVEPISRLRIRRFVGHGSYQNLELGVPEKRVYGNNFPNFYETLAPYLLSAQKQTIESVKQIAQKTNTNGYVNLRSWNLTGGSYEDTSGDDLFEKFFETELEFTGATGKEASSLERDDTEERVNALITDANRRFEHCAVYADVDWDAGGGDDAYVMFGGTVSVAVNKEIEFNPNWRTVRDLIQRMSESFDIITGDEIDVLEEPGKTIFEFRLGNEDGSTVDDLDNFIYEVRRLDNNIEDAIDTWVNILMEEGYIENPLADLEEQFEGIQHFELSTDADGAYAGAKTDSENQPIDGVVRIDLRQLFGNIQNLTDLNTSNKYFEDFFRSVWSKWTYSYHDFRNPIGKEVKSKITNNFINRLKVELDPQQSLFEIASQRDPSAPIQRKPITEKTLSELGVSFDISVYDRGSVEGRTIGFDFKPIVSCDVKRGDPLDPTSIMVFMKLVKFFDKNFKNLANFYRQKLLEIVNETYEEIIEKIKQKKTPKETYNPYNYKQEKLTHQVTTPYGGTYTEYIGENKKVFKKAGKNWSVIK